MPELLVTESELKIEYKRKSELWDKVYQRVFLAYAKLRWRHNPLVAYPLVIDIRLGTMKYHFFKFGAVHVKRRIDAYHALMMTRLKGEKIADLENTDEFYIKTVLTDQESINDQLDKEIIQHYKF